mmetsp:Transcript_62836/g.199020  ORF Transcript_62836/g.199020 Transcript_62836/m.199020 type:complete len:204 (-) Transcript_62836:925-1536(-)
MHPLLARAQHPALRHGPHALGLDVAQPAVRAPPGLELAKGLLPKHGALRWRRVGREDLAPVADPRALGRGDRRGDLLVERHARPDLHSLGVARGARRGPPPSTSPGTPPLRPAVRPPVGVLIGGAAPPARASPSPTHWAVRREPSLLLPAPCGLLHSGQMLHPPLAQQFRDQAERLPQLARKHAGCAPQSRFLRSLLRLPTRL